MDMIESPESFALSVTFEAVHRALELEMRVISKGLQASRKFLSALV
jgi:hypothetical protein